MRLFHILILSTAMLGMTTCISIAEPVPETEQANDQSPQQKALLGKPTAPVYVPVEEFRKRFHAAEGASAIVAVFQNANEFIRSHAINGASEFVILTLPDGGTSYGRDYFFSGPPLRLHEIRASYDAIGVDHEVCFSKPSQKEWDCRSLGLTMGIREIFSDAVVRWSHREQICETGVCDAYRVIVADTVKPGNTRMIAENPDQDHFDLTLILRQDGTPVMFSETQFAAGEIEGAPATYVYDFSTPVAPFDLPVHR